MADFAFRPSTPTKSSIRDELEGHELAKSGITRKAFEEREDLYDKLNNRYDDLPNANRAMGFNKMRKLMLAGKRANRG